MRVGIEYISVGTIKVTTPYRQKVMSLPKRRDAFAIDFNSLSTIPATGFYGSGFKTQDNMVMSWNADDHELYIRIGDDALYMPKDTTNLVISVVE
jgi:hypothetical protein